MKYLTNINRIHDWWNRFGIDYAVSDIFLCHFLSCSQQLKVTKLSTGENFELTRKSFEPTKYPRENILDWRNTHKKIASTHKTTTKKL